MGLFSRNKKGLTYNYKNPQDQEHAYRRVLANLNAGTIHAFTIPDPPVHGARAMVQDENGVPVEVEYADEQGRGNGTWKKPGWMEQWAEDNKRGREKRRPRSSAGIVLGAEQRHTPHDALIHIAPSYHSGSAQTAAPSSPNPYPYPQLHHPFHAKGLRSSSRALMPRSQFRRSYPIPISTPHHPPAPDPLATQQHTPLGMHGRRAHVPGQTELQARFLNDGGTQTDPGQRYRYLAGLEALRRANEERKEGGKGKGKGKGEKGGRRKGE